MKSLLVLAPHPQFADQVRAAVKSLELRVVHRLTVEEAEPLLVHELSDTCVLDLQSAGVQAVWMVERILRRAPRCRIIAFAESREPEWEEELFLAGVAQILSKPVRERLLVSTIQSLGAGRQEMPAPSTIRAVSPVQGAVDKEAGEAPAHDATLLAMRRFSEILTHSLDAGALVRGFLNLLRETMGINRAAIFLSPSLAGGAEGESPGESAWMKAVCAIGVAPALVENLTLSPESGIGWYLVRTGRILRRSALEIADADAGREFDMMGAEVAIPIMGREELTGVALFDRRVTGQPLTNSELETVFHLLEQVGRAITNIHTHDQLVGSNQLLGDVLKELSNACVVVGPDLTVLHANKAARRLIGASARRSTTLDFGDLPEVLGAKVYQVIQTGAAIPPFRYETESGGKSIHSVSVVPIQSAVETSNRQGISALMVIEDRTQAEQLKQLEVEAANLRLVNSMADRLVAEIGNLVVPFDVHHQLFDQRIKEADFRKSLQSTLGDGVKRINRLLSQMRFIYGNASSKMEQVSLGKVLDEADEEVRGSFPKAVLDCGAEVRAATLKGNSNALRHSFSEIILNGYQANDRAARVQVRLIECARSNGEEEIGIEFTDAGEGFAEETARQASLPFFTKRAAGVGLGLAAAKKIIEDHGGRIEIPATGAGGHGVVRVYLPVRQTQE